MPNRVAFLLPNLAGGGTERLTIDLLAAFVARGYAVDLLLLRQTGDFVTLVPPGVRVIDFQVDKLRQAFGPLRRYCRDERPAALLAALWPLTVIAIAAVIGLRPRPRVVVSDHCALEMQYGARKSSLALLKMTILASYRWADAVVGVSDGVSDTLARLGWLDRARVTTIINPVVSPLRSARDPEALWPPRPARRILSVGRLTAQKNQRLLVESFARLIAQGVDAVLAIVGQGELRGELEAQVARLGLQGRVLLPGFDSAPGDWYAGADLFVLSSDYEGLGNVLIEAMHHGLSVVTTDCPSGPAEVVGGGRWGALVPPRDPVAMAQAMREALDHPADPDSQRARAAKFTVAAAVDAYAQLLLPGASAT